jgi:hypothetical protein
LRIHQVYEFFSLALSFATYSPLKMKSTNANPVLGDTVYVAVSGNPYDAGSRPQAFVEYYVIPTDPQRRKQCGFGSCCCCLLLAFLLLFFLIPRTPSCFLDNVVNEYTFTGNSTINNFIGKFSFQNNNYFPVTWDNADINAYWLVNNDFKSLCFAADPSAQCDFVQQGLCAINIGEFKSSSSFSTQGKHTSHQSFGLSQTSQQQKCTVALALQATSYEQFFVTQGSVHAKAAVRDFGNIQLGDVVYGVFLNR